MSEALQQKRRRASERCSPDYVTEIVARRIEIRYRPSVSRYLPSVFSVCSRTHAYRGIAPSSANVFIILIPTRQMNIFDTPGTRYRRSEKRETDRVCSHTQPRPRPSAIEATGSRHSHPPRLHLHLARMRKKSFRKKKKTDGTEKKNEKKEKTKKKKSQQLSRRNSAVWQEIN